MAGPKMGIVPPNNQITCDKLFSRTMVGLFAIKYFLARRHIFVATCLLFGAQLLEKARPIFMRPAKKIKLFTTNYFLAKYRAFLRWNNSSRRNLFLSQNIHNNSRWKPSLPLQRVLIFPCKNLGFSNKILFPHKISLQ